MSKYLVDDYVLYFDEESKPVFKSGLVGDKAIESTLKYIKSNRGICQSKIKHKPKTLRSLVDRSFKFNIIPFELSHVYAKEFFVFLNGIDGKVYSQEIEEYVVN